MELPFIAFDKIVIILLRVYFKRKLLINIKVDFNNQKLFILNKNFEIILNQIEYRIKIKIL